MSSVKIGNKVIFTGHQAGLASLRRALEARQPEVDALVAAIASLLNVHDYDSKKAIIDAALKQVNKDPRGHHLTDTAIHKLAFEHGVEDMPNIKNEYRLKRIVSMVRAALSAREV